MQPLLAAIRQFMEFRHNEIGSFVADTLNQRERLESISRAELLRRLHEGDVTLLDVRPAEEFASGPLPNAINIPVEELASRLPEYSSSKRWWPIVAGLTVRCLLMP
ncbi:rhodanese-like domain-containing protein [Serratia fonticola]|uniref:rhodanese-like domain-containing protein n=1 Tax=Serratia fonticola TaxID=47917 RepID=UPI003AAEB1A6